MSRKKTKTRKPLTIAIHGDDLDIEATIKDSRLGDVLADAINRMKAPATKPPPSPLAELVSEFGKTLRQEQLQSLVSLFDMPQKILFMEILNLSKADHAEN